MGNIDIIEEGNINFCSHDKKLLFDNTSMIDDLFSNKFCISSASKPDDNLNKLFLRIK